MTPVGPCSSLSVKSFTMLPVHFIYIEKKYKIQKKWREPQKLAIAISSYIQILVE